MPKKWKQPAGWGVYVPDKMEKGFNAPNISKALDKIGKHRRK